MDQQFSLSWNNFHGNLSKGFAGLLGKSEFVDVTIAVEGHLLQAHKVILSICSPYFKKMFQLNPCQHPIVVLRDISYKAMKDLLQFMYHGEVSVKREDLTSFIGTAEVLHIKGLTNKETDEDELDSEQELPNQNNSSQKTNQDNSSQISNAKEKCIPNPMKMQSEHIEINQSDKVQDNDKESQNYKELLDKLNERLNHLKRKSDDFNNIHNNSLYNNDIFSLEKRPKLLLKDTNTLISQNTNHILQNSIYDNVRNMFENRSTDIPSSHNHTTPLIHKNNDIDIEHEDKSKSDQSISNCSPVECKTEYKSECEEPDNINDQTLCNSPKLFDEGQKGSINNQIVQDYSSGLNTLFMDLKSLVNGKVTNSRKSNPEEVCRGVMEHRLVSIPQKEDGKKKYPQRSCRLCWKLGKRRDTRFMCLVCEMPFCKNPCFEVHFNDVVKTSHLNTDYFAN